MKTQGKVWIIYDAEKKTQTKPMSVIQAQVTLLSLAHKNPGKYFLWTPGWEEWICIREFLSSDQKYFVMAQPPKPTEVHFTQDTVTVTETNNTQENSPYTQVIVGENPLKSEEIGGYHIKDFNGDDLDLSKVRKVKPHSTKKKNAETSKEASGIDRRKDPRLNFKIEVVLVSKSRSFRTFSKNISLSGTMLEHEIPHDFMNKPFDLIIVNPFEPDPSRARLLFRAKFIGDMTDPRRLMFIEQDPQMTLRLDALLKAYMTYQDQLRKTAG